MVWSMAGDLIATRRDEEYGIPFTVARLEQKTQDQCMVRGTSGLINSPSGRKSSRHANGKGIWCCIHNGPDGAHYMGFLPIFLVGRRCGRLSEQDGIKIPSPPNKA
jgi:hypothetical protein